MNAAALDVEPLSVLVVEDSAADAELVREMLLDADPVAAGAVAPEVHHVETLRAALQAAERPFDVVLLDLGLPDASGFEALRALVAAVPHLPAVVLTGSDDPALGAEALAAGAHDFLVKGQVDGNLLLRSLRFAAARQQHRTAQGAVRARDQLISVASHELRAPVSALHLAVHALGRALEASGDDATARGVRVASKSVERLTRLVNTLLDSSRLEAGGYQLAREPLDLRRVVLETLEQLRSAATAAGCELRLEAPEPVLGSWDRTAVEQVVVNLVDNALRYAPGTPVEIAVARAGEDAVLAVRDHGGGIAPEDAARIFEQFERGAAARHPAGLGLGLYIARQLVEVHGGTIEVDSPPGAGATFRVLLPLSRRA